MSPILHRSVSAVMAMEESVSGFAYMVCVVCRMEVRCAVTGLRDGYLSAGNEERCVTTGQTVVKTGLGNGRKEW